MEWVETTGKTLDEAKDRALDQLGVAGDEAEFDVLEEPRSGLFGRVRGEARVRARVRPTEARPKQERRHRGRSKSDGDAAKKSSRAASTGGSRQRRQPTDAPSDASSDASSDESSRSQRESSRSKQPKERKLSNDSNLDRDDRPAVSPQAVGDAAVSFMSGLVEALGTSGSTELAVDGTELDVTVQGDDLGLLIGPGGRTLQAVQDLARVASQRRLGDHDTRLRIDVAGYRVRRREALEHFARQVATQVIESGTAKALEPMSSADRKSVHDALTEIDGVTSHSEGDDPTRRVVISPA